MEKSKAYSTFKDLEVYKTAIQFTGSSGFSILPKAQPEKSETCLT